MAEAIGDYDTTGGSDAEPGRRPLGSLLIGAGFITEAQLAEALHEGSASGERVGEVVVRRGWATEDDVAKLLAEQWGLGYVERASIFFDSDALGRMSREEAQRLEALPTRVQDGRVVVAVAEPTDERLGDLRAVIGDDTVVVVVPKSALDAGLRSELLSGRPAEGGESGDRAADEQLEPVAPAPAAPQRTAVVRPLPQRAPRRPAGPARELEPELDGVLNALQSAAAEAATLGAGVAALSERLAELVQQAEAAAARLSEAAGAEESERATIERLEQQLSQRTELTESLKQQLAGLTRTLEGL
jgi:hypothetical protein